MRHARLFAALLLLFVSVAQAAANPYAVVDVATGKVLAHQQAFERWYPASITKIMTAYLAFEAVRSGDMSMRSPSRSPSVRWPNRRARWAIPSGPS